MKKSYYDSFVKLSLVYYSILFINGELDIFNIKSPVIIDAVVFIAAYIFYIRNYRISNILCFEVLFLPFAFIGMFFQDIFLHFFEFTAFDFINDAALSNKAKTIQMIAYLCLLLGCINSNRKFQFNPSNRTRTGFSYKYSYDNIIHVLSIILLLLIIYDYQSGIFSSWFYYSNMDWMDVENRNEGLGHLTCLLNAAAMIDIVRLKQKGVDSIPEYIKKCNKLFIGEWLFISGLLYASGNRNEMLLIVLPLAVAFVKCIYEINRRTIIIGICLGMILMVISGLVRQGADLESGSLNLLAFTRDFGPLAYNTEFLIKYTDNHSPTYFVDIPSYFLSGIPMFGYLILSQMHFNTPEVSANLTTEAAGTHSGMGTSLIGDLYYSGGVLWVVIFMYVLGYIMSKYYSAKELSIYKLSFYSYMVANAIYYVRSGWAFPITYIVYITVILLICRFSIGLTRN